MASKGAFVKVLEDNSIDGVVNGCGPNPITQKELTQAIAKSYKNFWVDSVWKDGNDVLTSLSIIAIDAPAFLAWLI